MDPKIYYFLHVFSIIALTGFTFASAAGKKKSAILTGILAVVALVAGAGLMSKIHGNNWLQAWVIIKIVAWLFVAALGGMAYKKSKSFVYSGLIIAVGVALYSVYILRF